MSGDTPNHPLFVCPLLKGKAVKRQRIGYTINDNSAALEWTPKSYESGFWDERWVSMDVSRKSETCSFTLSQ